MDWLRIKCVHTTKIQDCLHAKPKHRIPKWSKFNINITRHKLCVNNNEILHKRMHKSLSLYYNIWYGSGKCMTDHAISHWLQHKYWSVLHSMYTTVARGATRMSRGYQARPKIHVIRVVFQDQAMYARTSFMGAKMCKIGGKKRCFYGHIDKFWKGYDRQIKKNTCKKRVFKAGLPILPHWEGVSRFDTISPALPASM